MSEGRGEGYGNTWSGWVGREGGAGGGGGGGGGWAPQNTAEFTGPIEHSRMNRQKV